MDVTERLRSEQAVKQANEELARAYDATLEGLTGEAIPLAARIMF